VSVEQDDDALMPAVVTPFGQTGKMNPMKRVIIEESQVKLAMMSNRKANVIRNDDDESVLEESMKIF
jgi:hypothetical protein